MERCTCLWRVEGSDEECGVEDAREMGKIPDEQNSRRNRAMKNTNAGLALMERKEASI